MVRAHFGKNIIIISGPNVVIIIMLIICIITIIINFFQNNSKELLLRTSMHRLFKFEVNQTFIRGYNLVIYDALC